MKKVIVGITGNERELPILSGKKFITVAREMADGVREAGGLPIVIPVGDPALADDYVGMVDKLILSGGQHVEPSFYGEEKLVDSGDYLLERDRFELALIESALKQGKPIFAVCRGMQLLNVALGGSLQQVVENHWQTVSDGTSHSLEVKPQSQISQLFQQGSQINSFHTQRIKRLAPTLVATGIDPRDNTIEAYESRVGQSLLGIQWHPEYLHHDCEDNRRLFRFLVEKL
ncbi:TPA: gamma-glutamyl-gamma-aminobutyrate hydrolase family protein [Streptococcus suis]